MAKRVLVIAAHPDDEVLGAGGTIAWHKQRGDRVYALILGEGISARFATRKDALKKQNRKAFARLKQETQKAHARLGIEKTFRYEFPDNRFDSVDLLDIIKVLEEVKRQIKPEVVYTHHGGDLNVDHRIAFEAVVTACRPASGEPVKRILAFEVPSSTEWIPPQASRVFVPNVFVEIGPFLEAKLKAMSCYQSELRAYPHPRSLEAIRQQAQVWGVKAGLHAAEAFMLIRDRIG